MNIRAHHLLCMQAFNYGGHDEKFNENFASIIRRLKENPEITIVDRCDGVCSGCPHIKNDECHRVEGINSGVVWQDRVVMSTIGISRGHKGRVFDILDLIKQRIHGDDLSKICGPCGFLGDGYCAKAIDSKKYFQLEM